MYLDIKQYFCSFKMIFYLLFFLLFPGHCLKHSCHNVMCSVLVKLKGQQTKSILLESSSNKHSKNKFA